MKDEGYVVSPLFIYFVEMIAWDIKYEKGSFDHLWSYDKFIVEK